MVGLPNTKPTLDHFAIVSNNLVFSGSTIGNTAMEQEMLNFCGEHNITADVEVRCRGRMHMFWPAVVCWQVAWMCCLDDLFWV